VLLPSIYPSKQKLVFTNTVSYPTSPKFWYLVPNNQAICEEKPRNEYLVVVVLNLEVDDMLNRIWMWGFQGAKWEYQPGVCAMYDTHPTLIRVQKGREPIKQSM
jgi:hypothetical protein